MLNSNNNNKNNNNSEFIIFSGFQYNINFVLTYVCLVVNILIWILHCTFAVQVYYMHKESKQLFPQQPFLFIVISN